MNTHLRVARSLPVVELLRAATGEIHRRLERRLDIIERLSVPAERTAMIARYAALHVPADAALRPLLEHLAGLDFSARSRAPALARHAGDAPLPPFPAPANRPEALGMLYVLEGATLGGHVITRALAERGIADQALAFLDPYGPQTGARWRDFLAVLVREIGEDEERATDACAGAVTAFAHAERILCGDP